MPKIYNIADIYTGQYLPSVKEYLKFDSRRPNKSSYSLFHGCILYELSKNQVPSDRRK